VPHEMRHQVLGEFDIGEFVVRIDHEDSHGTRRAHKRQGVLHCPAGFAAAVPSDQHILADPVRPTAGIRMTKTGRLQERTTSSGW